MWQRAGYRRLIFTSSRPGSGGALVAGRRRTGQAGQLPTAKPPDRDTLAAHPRAVSSLRGADE
jgi:hypothetical protein